MQPSHLVRVAIHASFMLAVAACSEPAPDDNPTGFAGAPAGSGNGGGAGRAGSGPAGTGGGAGSAGGISSVAGAGGRLGNAGGAGAAAGSGGASGAAGGGSGIGGQAGLGGASGAAGGAGAAGMMGAPPPCMEKPSQVVVLGDSYVNYVENLNLDIAVLAIADGSLQAGQEYRMYAVPGSSMASGGIAGFIPDQLTLAISEDPDMIAGIMTGGGNDLLIADPLLGGSDCINRMDAAMVQTCKDIVQMAIDKAEEMMMAAANAGIKDVVYFFYPHLPGGGFGGQYPNFILDYSYPLAENLCDTSFATTGGKLRCHFIDLRPVFEGKNWIADDLIHPNAEGSDAIAKEVYDVMKANCIAQPASRGCCMP